MVRAVFNILIFLYVYSPVLLLFVNLVKKVYRTSPCHSASCTAYTRFHHPLPRDSHCP